MRLYSLARRGGNLKLRARSAMTGYPPAVPLTPRVPRRDTMSTSYRIIVGVDGSEGSALALRWALR
jgi:hypothetical protein